MCEGLTFYLHQLPKILSDPFLNVFNILSYDNGRVENAYDTEDYDYLTICNEYCWY